MKSGMKSDGFPDTIVVPLTHRLQVVGPGTGRAGHGGTEEVPVTVPTFVIFTEVQAFAEAWRRNAPDPASSSPSQGSAAAVEGLENGAPGPVVVRGGEATDQRPEHRLSVPVDAPAPQHAEEAPALTDASMTAG